jgi:ubiquinone/menaquinone biosynthesis C-methylase UbiE
MDNKEEKIRSGNNDVGIREKEDIFWREYADFIVSRDGLLFLESPPYQHEFKCFSSFIKPKEGQRWLDVGCGALAIAKLICQLSEGKAEVLAGDIYLSPAKKELEKIGNSKIILKKVDLTKRFPFPDNYFDGITASKVLSYIIEFEGRKGKEGLKDMFKELFRVLKPGGVLVWSFLRSDMNRWKGAILYLGYLFNPYQWLKTRCFLPGFALRMLKWAQPFEEKVKKRIYYSLSKEEYEELMKSAGFENPEWKITFADQILISKVKKPL